jgi:hypothetical protein
MSQKNGAMMTQKQLKDLAELTLQCDERIEQLWDLMIEIRLGVADEGGIKLKNDKEWRVAAQQRAKVAGLQKKQRDRQRKYFGLD